MKKTCMALICILLNAGLYAARVNDPAPPFSAFNSRNKKVSLSDYKGKVVFINFWASWCAPCQNELPRLDKLAQEYTDRNFVLLAVNVDDDPAAAGKIIEKLNLRSSSMEILRDADAKIVTAYNVDTMPSSFILDTHGVIRAAHAGFHPHDPATWRKEINALLH